MAILNFDAQLFRKHISEIHLIKKNWNTALILEQGFFLGNKLLWNQSAKMQKKRQKTLKLLKKGQEWRHTSWKNVENCLFESWHIKKPQLVNVSAKEFSIKTCLIYPLLLGKGVKPDIGNFPLSSLSMAESFYYLELEKTYRKDLNATFGET